MFSSCSRPSQLDSSTGGAYSPSPGQGRFVAQRGRAGRICVRLVCIWKQNILPGSYVCYFSSIGNLNIVGSSHFVLHLMPGFCKYVAMVWVSGGGAGTGKRAQTPG